MEASRRAPPALLRALILLAALALVVLWVDLAVRGPAPGAVRPDVSADAALPPVALGVAIFSALAVVAAGAAFRGAPIIVALAGLISLVPVGLYTLLLPWPHRAIGLLDGVLVLAGVVLLRTGAGDA